MDTHPGCISFLVLVLSNVILCREDDDSVEPIWDSGLLLTLTSLILWTKGRRAWHTDGMGLDGAFGTRQGEFGVGRERQQRARAPDLRDARQTGRHWLVDARTWDCFFTLTCV